MGCENECLGNVLVGVCGRVYITYLLFQALQGWWGGGGGARQETKSHEKKGRQTVDKEELVTSEGGGGDLGVGVTVLSRHV